MASKEPHLEYTRLYADEDGVSHFEDLEFELSEVDFVPPAAPLLMSSPIESTRTVFFAVPAGWDGDWHPAPRRQFFVQIAGELELKAGDGNVRRFTSGDVVLLEDTTGGGHVTRVVGDSDARGVFVQLAE